MVAERAIRGFSILAFCGITFTVLADQIVLSRLFAGTMTYYYAFMLISLAMLGLGSGSLLVDVFPGVFRIERFHIQSAGFSMAMGITAFLGTLSVLWTYPHLNLADLDSYGSNFWTLAILFFSVFPTFLFGGLVVSLVLGHGRDQFSRLYSFDLIAGAIGCAISIVLLSVITPVECMLKVLAVIPFVSAALFALNGAKKNMAGAAIGMAVAFLAAGAALSASPDIAKPPHIRSITTKTFVSEWNTFSSVRVHPGGFFSWCLSPRYNGPRFPMLLLMIDGVGGTPIVQFDGKPESLQKYDYLDNDLTALGQSLVPNSGRQLIIGPGGGFDVLQSIRRGRTDINIVEINPLVARIVNEDLADFSGRPYHLPGVQLHIENGRTFVKRSKQTWDLMTVTWVDTGGSPHAVAFSENYLYTVDAYREYLEHLNANGIFAFVRALDYPAIKIDALRGITIATEALRQEGVQDPGRHIMVIASQSPYFMKQWIMCLVLVKKSAFTADEIARSKQFIDEKGFHAMWLPDNSVDSSSVEKPFAPFAPLIRSIITATDRQALYENANLDIAPTTDDNPFYFVERPGKNREAGIGIKNLGAYLLIQGMLVIPFLFVPLIPGLKNTRKLGSMGAAALVYFVLLGTAFMLVEIEFFNVFALVLGSPTVTLATVLSGLLVFSGLGSLWGGAKLGQRNPRFLVLVFGCLVGLLSLLLLFKGALLSFLVALPFGVRVLGTALTIAPIAFFMGMPMPGGMTLIRDRADLVLWGFALNGAFSVFASTAALFLTMNFGAARTFGFGLLLYATAGGVLLYLQMLNHRGTETRSQASL